MGIEGLSGAWARRAQNQAASKRDPSEFYQLLQAAFNRPQRRPMVEVFRAEPASPPRPPDPWANITVHDDRLRQLMDGFDAPVSYIEKHQAEMELYA